MNRTETMAEALRLVNQAQYWIQCGEPRAALWRLVDAAGLLAEAYGGGTIGGDEPTGQGYRVVRAWPPGGGA